MAVAAAAAADSDSNMRERRGAFIMTTMAADNEEKQLDCPFISLRSGFAGKVQ